jgi:hypothetical protein
MIFKIFSPKNAAKKLTFLTQNKAKLCKILIITLVFDKNANFSAEYCRKSLKIVIITSTPGPFTRRNILQNNRVAVLPHDNKWKKIFFVRTGLNFLDKAKMQRSYPVEIRRRNQEQILSYVGIQHGISI